MESPEALHLTLFRRMNLLKMLTIHGDDTQHAELNEPNRRTDRESV